MGHCFICLRAGHDARNCRNPKVCFHCKRNTHHRSTYPEKFDNARASTTLLNHEATPFSQSLMGVAVADGSPATHVSMQTAVIMVYNESTERCMARISFNTCASRSFMSRSLCEKLQCKPIDHGTVSLASFGSSERQNETLPRVKVQFELPNHTQRVFNMNVTPVTCCPTQRFPIPVDTELGKIKLAEPPAQQVERVDVDILMGLDYCHDFITESSLVLPNGLYFVQSAFGYIPSGNVNTTQDIEHEVLTVSSTEQDATISELNQGMWWNGQPWLNDESLWPVSDKPEKETPVSVHITQGEDKRLTPAGIDPDRFSSFGKLIRVTAYIQKFIKRLQKIPVENELQRAETQWLGYVKHHRYGEEIQALNHGKSTDLGNKLGFFIDNMGLIKCRYKVATLC